MYQTRQWAAASARGEAVTEYLYEGIWYTLGELCALTGCTKPTMQKRILRGAPLLEPKKSKRDDFGNELTIPLTPSARRRANGWGKLLRSAQSRQTTEGVSSHG